MEVFSLRFHQTSGVVLTMKLHTVKAPAGEVGIMGHEPTWDASNPVTDKTYRIQMQRALAWHAYCADPESYPKYLEEWAREHRASTLKDDTRKLDALPKSLVPRTLATIARMQLQGFPLVATDVARLHTMFDELPEPSKRVATSDDEDSEKPKVSVQDRIRAQVTDVLSEIDEAADILTDGDGIDPAAMQEVLFDATFKEPHFRFIIAHLDEYINQWSEIVEARSSKDQSDEQEQLVEGTRHLKPRTVTNAIKTFVTLRDAVKGHVSVAKAKKVRKKKPVDKQKVVARIRFAKEDKDLGITSINPVDILGATELWVYDTKRRRIQHYVGEVAGSLHVKGAKLLGYSEEKSGSKVLRKPEEQLKEFMALRKNQTEKWYDGVRAKAAPLNGRTATYLLLLKVA